MKKPFTVGITGGSGSGKTFFLQGLSSRFKPEEICLISQDHYYKAMDEQPVDPNGVINFDLPVTIDKHAFHDDLVKLKNGKTVEKLEYTFNNPKVVPRTLTFQPAPIIVVEGLFIQYFEEIEKELDLKIFIDAKEHIMLGRRLKRDLTERGYDIDETLYRYQFHVMPIYESLIGPLKQNSDIVVPNNGHVDRALDVVCGFLKSKVS